MTRRIRALIIDTKWVAGLNPGQVDVEEITEFHYVIYFTHPLSDHQKLEAISKFKGEDLTLLHHYSPEEKDHASEIRVVQEGNLREH